MGRGTGRYKRAGKQLAASRAVSWWARWWERSGAPVVYLGSVAMPGERLPGAVCPTCGALHVANVGWPKQVPCGCCKAPLILPVEHRFPIHSDDAELAVDAVGSNITDGRLDGSGGWVLWTDGKTPPDIYTLLRSDDGGAVDVIHRGTSATVTASGECICMGERCKHQALVSSIFGWDPFAPRKATHERSYLGNRDDFHVRLGELVSFIDKDFLIGDLAGHLDWLDLTCGCCYEPNDWQFNWLAESYSRHRTFAHKLEALIHPGSWVHQDRVIGQLWDTRNKILPQLAAILDRPSMKAAKKEFAALGHKIETSAATGCFSDMVDGLAAFNEYLRYHGLTDPELPEEPLCCGCCGRLLPSGGVCIKCVAAAINQHPVELDDFGFLPNHFNRFHDWGLDHIERSFLRFRSALNEAARRDDENAWRVLAMFWNQLTGGGNQRLPLSPPRCSRCNSVLQADGLCRNCPQDEQPDKLTCLAGIALWRSEAQALRPVEIVKLGLSLDGPVDARRFSFRIALRQGELTMEIDAIPQIDKMTGSRMSNMWQFRDDDWLNRAFGRRTAAVRADLESMGVELMGRLGLTWERQCALNENYDRWLEQLKQLA